MKVARTTPAAGNLDGISSLDASDLFSPPVSPYATGERNGGPVNDPPSPGPPPEHMPPQPADRIQLRKLREVDHAAGTTIDDLFEPQTACCSILAEGRDGEGCLGSAVAARTDDTSGTDAAAPSTSAEGEEDR